MVGCGSEAPTPTPTPIPPPTEKPAEPTPTAEKEAEADVGLVAGGAGLAVPPGFGANVFFLGLSNPTSIAVSDDGVVYVSQQDGAIAALRDMDSDGEADSVGLYARGFPAPLGLAHREDTLYVSSRGSVTALLDSDGTDSPMKLRRLCRSCRRGYTRTTAWPLGPTGRCISH